MAARKHEIRALLRLLKNRAPDRLLNDVVRAAKLKEAAAINRGGQRRQLDFLLERHGLRDTQRLVGKLMAELRDSREIAAVLQRRRLMPELVGALYRYKACEAEALAVMDVTAQVKFLKAAVGGRERLLSILGDL